MGYDRGDSIPVDFEPDGIPFGSKSKGKMSPLSYPIQCERKWKSSFLSVDISATWAERELNSGDKKNSNKKKLSPLPNDPHNKTICTSKLSLDNSHHHLTIPTTMTNSHPGEN